MKVKNLYSVGMKIDRLNSNETHTCDWGNTEHTDEYWWEYWYISHES